MRSRIAMCILSLSVAVFSIMLGGCSNNENYPENSGENVGTELLSPNLSAVSNISTENPAQSSPTLTALESSPQVDNREDFIGADGRPVTLENAAVNEDGRVTLDYCFVKFLPQIYDDTFKNPALIDWETMEFAEFDGELTLSGALYCTPEDDYQVFCGELYFFPDTTSGVKLPAQCGIVPSEYCVCGEYVYPEANFAVRSSGTIYYVGNINDVELDGILERGKAVEVTVTLGNIRIENSDINHGGRGGGCFAEIVSIEKINS